jgi:[ribosomal protein S5]-alanine N-acetyltransferase
MSDVPTLNGALCKLRALELADAALLQKHADDRAVARNLFEGFPSPYKLTDAELWCTTQSREPSYGLVWGIEYGSEIIGCAGLRPDQGWVRCNAEMGYWIGQAHWGKGITSEAVRLVTQWAWLHRPEITRIYAPIFAWNEGSQAVVRKCGYEREGVMRQSAIKGGVVIDRIVYASYRSFMSDFDLRVLREGWDLRNV